MHIGDEKIRVNNKITGAGYCPKENFGKLRTSCRSYSRGTNKRKGHCFHLFQFTHELWVSEGLRSNYHRLEVEETIIVS